MIKVREGVPLPDTWSKKEIGDASDSVVELLKQFGLGSDDEIAAMLNTLLMLLHQREHGKAN